MTRECLERAGQSQKPRLLQASDTFLGCGPFLTHERLGRDPERSSSERNTPTHMLYSGRVSQRRSQRDINHSRESGFLLTRLYYGSLPFYAVRAPEFIPALTSRSSRVREIAVMKLFREDLSPILNSSVSSIDLSRIRLVVSFPMSLCCHKRGSAGCWKGREASRGVSSAASAKFPEKRTEAISIDGERPRT